MKIKPQDTQLAFSIIQQMASLAATPNISATNVEKANKTITHLLERIVIPATQDLTAEASGLIVK